MDAVSNVTCGDISLEVYLPCFYLHYTERTVLNFHF